MRDSLLEDIYESSYENVILEDNCKLRKEIDSLRELIIIMKDKFNFDEKINKKINELVYKE